MEVDVTVINSGRDNVLILVSLGPSERSWHYGGVELRRDLMEYLAFELLRSTVMWLFLSSCVFLFQFGVWCHCTA